MIKFILKSALFVFIIFFVFKYGGEVKTKASVFLTKIESTKNENTGINEDSLIARFEEQIRTGPVKKVSSLTEKNLEKTQKETKKKVPDKKVTGGKETQVEKSQRYGDEVEKEESPPPAKKLYAENNKNGAIKNKKPTQLTEKEITLVYINNHVINDERVVGLLKKGPKSVLTYEERNFLSEKINTLTGLNPFSVKKELFPLIGVNQGWKVNGRVMITEDGEKVLFLSLTDARTTQQRF